ncbi:MAG: PDZ domain-containing protein [Polyangiaceae bacterium]
MSLLKPRALGVGKGIGLAAVSCFASFALGDLAPWLVFNGRSAQMSHEQPSEVAPLGVAPQTPETSRGPTPSKPLQARPRALASDPLQAQRCAGLSLGIVAEFPNARDSLATLRTKDGRSRTLRFGGSVDGARLVYVGTDPQRGRPTAWMLEQQRLCRVAMFEAPAVDAADGQHGNSQHEGGSGNAGLGAATGRQGAAAAAGATHPAIVPLDDTHYRVDRSLVGDLLRDPGLLASGVIASPAQGAFVVHRLTPHSLPAKLGVRQGDRITQVNGIDVSDVEGLMRAAASLSRAQDLRLRLLRDGRRVELRYAIE